MKLKYKILLLVIVFTALIVLIKITHLMDGISFTQ